MQSKKEQELKDKIKQLQAEIWQARIDQLKEDIAKSQLKIEELDALLAAYKAEKGKQENE